MFSITFRILCLIIKKFFRVLISVTASASILLPKLMVDTVNSLPEINSSIKNSL